MRARRRRACPACPYSSRLERLKVRLYTAVPPSIGPEIYHFSMHLIKAGLQLPRLQKPKQALRVRTALLNTVMPSVATLM